MGFGTRLVKKSVRKATPRSVKTAMSPVRAVKYAATPRSVQKVSRAVYTVTNPLGAAQNKVIGSVLNVGTLHRRPTGSRTPARSNGQQAPQVVTGVGVRAEEGAASHQRLAALMAVQRERFSPAEPPVIAAPETVDPAPFERQEWERRKGETRIWQRSLRKEVKLQVAETAERMAQEALAEANQEYQRHRAEAARWWKALNIGDANVTRTALDAAFADNPAPTRVLAISRQRVAVEVILPELDVLPDKTAHVTPSGRLSNRAWKKTEKNEVYAELLAAHVVATIRETWAVAPGATGVRVVGRWPDEDDSHRVVFDVDATRGSGDWDDDGSGLDLLADASTGLRFTGRAKEVTAWPVDEVRPATLDLLDRPPIAESPERGEPDPSPTKPEADTDAGGEADQPVAVPGERSQPTTPPGDGLAVTTAPAALPGWYEDPWKQAAWRWWDGHQWSGYLA